MEWESNGVGEATEDFDCSQEDPTSQGQGISDKYLRCLAGTGDFRIGFFESTLKVGNDSCEGNSEGQTCVASLPIETSFNNYKGSSPYPSTSKPGFENLNGRLIEEKSNGERESHNNSTLWSRIKPGENGLMSDQFY